MRVDDAASAAWAPSLEARLLRHPRLPLDRLTPASAERRWWTCIRRPLLLLFLWGCTTSLQASGRFTIRLMADGMISFAFVPIVQIAALAIAARRRPAGLSFARMADRFFAGNGPWILWFIALGVLRGIESPVEAATGAHAAVFAVLVATAGVWSAWIDFWFFRDVIGEPPVQAFTALVIDRAIGWTVAIGYFFGVAIWPILVGGGRA